MTTDPTPAALALPQAAVVADACRDVRDMPAPAWLTEVRVVVVLGHPGAEDTTHHYRWAIE